MEQWTIKKLLEWITGFFTEKNVDAPRLSAERLLSHVLELPRIELYTNFETVASPDKLASLRALVKRCVDQEPLAYLIGKTEFYSMEFKVTPDTLIPRPETELLVERAVGFLRKRSAGQYVCDLCTGSGCIAAAIAQQVPDANIIATDISDAALAVAAENVDRHNLADHVKLLCGDLFTPIIDGLDETRFDLVVSNPPYVTTAEYETLDKNVKDYEPAGALAAGPDGMDIYRRITGTVADHLKEDAALILEIGYAQGPAVKELLKLTNLFAQITIEKDFSNNDRIVIAKTQIPDQPQTEIL